MKTPKTTSEAKWLPGALALAAVGAATHANAATVQITFTGSYISTTGGETAGNHLVADFGGDGAVDLFGILGRAGTGAVYNAGLVFAGMGFIASAGLFSGYSARVFGAPLGVSDGSGALVALGLVPISFTDANVRGGAPTLGYLDLMASAISPDRGRITVNRLVFDDATGGTIAGLNVSDAAFTEYSTSAVPEASTSLGLLALGAGGILTRRRSKRAA
jgi:hypothetical protein